MNAIVFNSLKKNLGDAFKSVYNNKNNNNIDIKHLLLMFLLKTTFNLSTYTHFFLIVMKWCREQHTL